MIEIALCLGIIAFALIAIIGVLPAGMKVQRENREETVISQDATVLLEAIRSGSKGLDDLTNYVESIIVRSGAQTFTYTNDLARPGGLVPLTNGQHIVSLLSMPKTERLANGAVRPTSVRARVKSISGVALDKSKNFEDFAFRYEIISEVVPFAKDALTTNIPPQSAAALGGDVLHAVNLSRNLYEVRLTMRWPLFQRGGTWDVGRYRKTFRTLVSAELVPVYTNSTPNLYLFEPNTFISAY